MNQANDIVQVGQLKIHLVYKAEKKEGYEQSVQEEVILGVEGLPKDRIIYMDDINDLKALHAALGKIIRFADMQHGIPSADGPISLGDIELNLSDDGV